MQQSGKYCNQQNNATLVRTPWSVMRQTEVRFLAATSETSLQAHLEQAWHSPTKYLELFSYVHRQNVALS